MTEPSRTRRPNWRVWGAIAGVLALVGAVAVVLAVTGQQSAPQPTAATGDRPESAAPSDPPAPATGEAPPAPPTEAPAAETEQVAEPVSMSVPSIGVSSELLRLGLNDDGTVEVPPLVPDERPAGTSAARLPAPSARPSSWATSTPRSTGPESSSTSVRCSPATR